MKIITVISSIIVVLLLFVSLSNGSSKHIPSHSRDVKRITTAEVKQLQQQEKIVIIDTRAAGEWLRAKDKASKAIRIQTYEDLAQFKLKVPLNQAIVVYCT